LHLTRRIFNFGSHTVGARNSMPKSYLILSPIDFAITRKLA